ncbi:hypothetical protein WA1_21115 [Scytonema hofmannii PCC 7110]|uniref:DUF1822 domain-containing protein n=1 Tax=Scytonema hofmannii PCC 7110 TaxID=128403 RepID=A0A139XCP7_9CYAN|nr:DUF1822 family protein [Scytonema hofmannii]KYC42467.1 hypothetical protein WA1_21115 [Scytonema hofmannii PCC 7110]
MVNGSVYSQNRRWKLPPEVIYLETEHFESAKEISDQNLNEAHQWKIYLNALALLGFEKWLRERIPDIKINRDNYSIFQPDSISAIADLGYLSLGDFHLCLITVDNLINDFVSVPEEAITSPKTAAHFYILLEVLEEEEQLSIHGFLRYDKLVKYCQSINLNAKSDNCYQLPLSWFDPEVNNLLLYSRFLSPTAISLPSVVEVNNTEIQNLPPATSIATKALVNVTNWWREVFEEGWQSSKNIWKTVDSNYAWGYVRSLSLADYSSGTKKLDFGLLLNGQSVALVVNLKRVENNEFDVLVQVIPCYEEYRDEQYLPSGLKLKITLNPNTSKSESQEVTARKTDNIIQLEFSEAPGKQFQIEVSFKNAVITEDFLL